MKDSYWLPDHIVDMINALRASLDAANDRIAELEAEARWTVSVPDFIKSTKHLHWTTTPPTEPGWYWWQLGTECELKNISAGRSSDVLYCDGSRVYFEMLCEHGSRWAGPIQEPSDE